MCGVFGCVAAEGTRRSVSDALAIRLRDSLSHRGPDDAGLWADEAAVFGHRRLSVMDPTPAGHQPMLADAEGRVWCSGVDAERDRGARYVLVYNGELYNDPQMRRGLEAKGIVCESGCDTETVLRSLVRWGVRAVGEFRGMFALAFYDREARKLWLVRDPLGVKPLYYHASRGGGGSGGGEVVFASEVGAVLGAPGVAVRPNAAMISAYLTTIRTVIGSSTVYEGVLAVRPGEVVEFDLSGGVGNGGGGGLGATAGLYWRGSEEITEPVSMGVASEWVRWTTRLGRICGAMCRPVRFSAAVLTARSRRRVRWGVWRVFGPTRRGRVRRARRTRRAAMICRGAGRWRGRSGRTTRRRWWTGRVSGGRGVRWWV